LCVAIRMILYVGSDLIQVVRELLDGDRGGDSGVARSADRPITEVCIVIICELAEW